MTGISRYTTLGDPRVYKVDDSGIPRPFKDVTVVPFDGKLDPPRDFVPLSQKQLNELALTTTKHLRRPPSASSETVIVQRVIEGAASLLLEDGIWYTADVHEGYGYVGNQAVLIRYTDVVSSAVRFRSRAEWIAQFDRVPRSVRTYRDVLPIYVVALTGGITGPTDILHRGNNFIATLRSLDAAGLLGGRHKSPQGWADSSSQRLHDFMNDYSFRIESNRIHPRGEIALLTPETWTRAEDETNGKTVQLFRDPFVSVIRIVTRDVDTTTMTPSQWFKKVTEVYSLAIIRWRDGYSTAHIYSVATPRYTDFLRLTFATIEHSFDIFGGLRPVTHGRAPIHATDRNVALDWGSWDRSIGHRTFITLTEEALKLVLAQYDPIVTSTPAPLDSEPPPPYVSDGDDDDDESIEIINSDDDTLDFERKYDSDDESSTVLPAESGAAESVSFKLPLGPGSLPLDFGSFSHIDRLGVNDQVRALRARTDLESSRDKFFRVLESSKPYLEAARNVLLYGGVNESGRFDSHVYVLASMMMTGNLHIVHHSFVTVGGAGLYRAMPNERSLAEWNDGADVQLTVDGNLLGTVAIWVYGSIDEFASRAYDRQNEDVSKQSAKISPDFVFIDQSAAVPRAIHQRWGHGYSVHLDAYLMAREAHEIMSMWIGRRFVVTMHNGYTPAMRALTALVSDGSLIAGRKDSFELFLAGVATLERAVVPIRLPDDYSKNVWSRLTQAIALAAVRFHKSIPAIAYGPITAVPSTGAADGPFFEAEPDEKTNKPPDPQPLGLYVDMFRSAPPLDYTDWIAAYPHVVTVVRGNLTVRINASVFPTQVQRAAGQVVTEIGGSLRPVVSLPDATYHDEQGFANAVYRITKPGLYLLVNVTVVVEVDDGVQPVTIVDVSDAYDDPPGPPLPFVEYDRHTNDAPHVFTWRREGGITQGTRRTNQDVLTVF
jgi:hypothetical protein